MKQGIPSATGDGKWDKLANSAWQSLRLLEKHK